MLIILTIVTSHFLQTLMWYPYPKPKKPVEKCLKMAWVIHLIIFLQLFFVLSMLHSNVCQECRARERPVINVIWRRKLQTKGHRPRALKWPFIELVVFVHRKHCKKGNYNSLNLNTLLHLTEYISSKHQCTRWQIRQNFWWTCYLCKHFVKTKHGQLTPYETPSPQTHIKGE